MSLTYILRAWNFCQIEPWNLRTGKDVNQNLASMLSYKWRENTKPGAICLEWKRPWEREAEWICSLPLSASSRDGWPALLPHPLQTLNILVLLSLLSTLPDTWQNSTFLSFELGSSQGFWSLCPPRLETLLGIKGQPRRLVLPPIHSWPLLGPLVLPARLLYTGSLTTFSSYFTNSSSLSRLCSTTSPLRWSPVMRNPQIHTIKLK